MSKTRAHRINEAIPTEQVRVVDEKGKQLGVMSKNKALSIARQRGLDLVEVAPDGKPPVCKLLNYDQFRYAQKKKTKDQKKKQKSQSCKEVWFRPGTADHDFNSKLKRIKAFLEEGNKVRIRVLFRGREATHPETGQAVLQKVIEQCKDMAKVELTQKQEPNNMVIIIRPRS